MNKLSKKIAASELLGNVAKLFSANVVAQVVGILVYPILSRLYSPDDFGLFNWFVTVASVLGLIATSEYQGAVLLPKATQKAAAVVHVGLMLSIGISLLILLLWPWSNQLADWVKVPELATYYPWLSLYVLYIGVWSMLNYWLTRRKNFTQIGIYHVTQSIVASGTKIGFGYAGILQGGLIYSTLIAPLAAISMSLWSAGKKVIRDLLKWNWSNCVEMAKEYRKFPLFSLPRTLVNTLSNSLPTLLLIPVFGKAAIGFYGMAISLAFRPINMMNGSLYQVLYERTSMLVKEEYPIHSIFYRYWRMVVLIGVPVFALLYGIMPWLVDLFLGNSWIETSLCIRAMLPWLLCSALVGPICFLSDLFGEQKKGLYFELLLIGLRSLGLLVGIHTHSFSTAVIGYSTGSAIAILCQLLWYWSLIRRYERSIEGN